MKAHLAGALPQVEPSVDELREFEPEEGKTLLIDWYSTHPGEHYPSDAATEIGMDLAQARDLTNALVQEGRLR